MRDIWDEMDKWLERGGDFAVARVVRTWGSSPRPVGAAMIVDRDMKVVGSVSGGCIEGAVIEEALGVLETGAAVFVQVFARRDRLLVVGAGHIAIHLVPFAQALDFAVTVIDPRQVFARAERFLVPPDELVASWPREALAHRELGDDTYAVLLTHDPKIDDEALGVLLRSDVRYIGALGSRKTHAERRERLAEAGFAEEVIGRVRGPVGLDIGAKSPAEIALSIMAEVVAVRRDR